MIKYPSTFNRLNQNYRALKIFVFILINLYEENVHIEIIFSGKEKYSLPSQVILQFYAKNAGDYDLSIHLGV